MKRKLVFSLTLFVCLLTASTINAQSTVSYKLPANFDFDFEVTQKVVSNKNPTDTCNTHLFYTKNGDYAGARINGRTNINGNLFLVMSRDGILILFDERKREITIVSLRKLMSDLTSLTKYLRVDSLLARMQKNKDGKDLESVKTGRSKLVGNYTSEEYSVTDSRGHKGFVWLAKVEFNGPADYILGAMSGNFQQMMNMMSGRTTGHTLMHDLMQSKTLVTEVELTDSTEAKTLNLHTLGISAISKNVSTSGYRINNYSNMSMAEIFQAEMKKRNE